MHIVFVCIYCCRLCIVSFVKQGMHAMYINLYDWRSMKEKITNFGVHSADIALTARLFSVLRLFGVRIFCIGSKASLFLSYLLLFPLSFSIHFLSLCAAHLFNFLSICYQRMVSYTKLLPQCVMVRLFHHIAVSYEAFKDEVCMEPMWFY